MTMCDCGCNSGLCGSDLRLSILGRGLSGLGNVKAGSRVRVGFRYSCAFCLEGSLDPAEVKSTVEGCLYSTGAYSQVNAQVTQGIIYQDYLVISAVPSIDFGQAEDIAGQMQQAFESCYPPLAKQISGHDPVVVDAVPVGTPIETMAVPPGTPGGPPAPDPCAMDRAGRPREGLDYVTCKLGLDSTAGGLSMNFLLIGLLAVVLLSRK